MEELGAENPARSFLVQVLASSESAARLVRQMLAYGGKGRFVLQALDLSQKIAEWEPLIRASVPPPVTLSLQLDPNLPLVEADPSQIQQLVMNLVVNAGEAIGEGSGVVTITTEIGRAHV